MNPANRCTRTDPHSCVLGRHLERPAEPRWQWLHRLRCAMCNRAAGGRVWF